MRILILIISLVAVAVSMSHTDPLAQQLFQLPETTLRNSKHSRLLDIRSCKLRVPRRTFEMLAKQLLTKICHSVHLVTTTQSTPEAESADLANVSATSLFDPFHQPNYLLRLIDDTYNSLPKFNLTGGVLSTLTNGIDPRTMYVYNSTEVQAGIELQFLPSEQSKGNLALKKGYLLSVDGEAEGWKICDGTFGYRVVCGPYPLEVALLINSRSHGRPRTRHVLRPTFRQ